MRINFSCSNSTSLCSSAVDRPSVSSVSGRVVFLFFAGPAGIMPSIVLLSEKALQVWDTCIGFILHVPIDVDGPGKSGVALPTPTLMAPENNRNETIYVDNTCK